MHCYIKVNGLKEKAYICEQVDNLTILETRRGIFTIDTKRLKGGNIHQNKKLLEDKK